ncbi:MAG: hypothetical protein WAL95_20675 [Candidatus Acidiferrales bacterium]
MKMWSANSGFIVVVIAAGMLCMILSPRLALAQNACAANGECNASSVNNFLFVDGVKYPTIQSALAALPPDGGTVFVPRGTAFDSAGLTISTQVHLIFDCGVFTYGGSGTAIRVMPASVSGVQIEGCATGDENRPTHGTSVRVTNPSANGLDVLGVASFVARNLNFVGPGSGSGIGVQLSGNGAQLYDIQADSFGGDGFQINGARSNTNFFVLQRVKAHRNGGHGFNTFGINSNVGTWIATFAQANRDTQYLFNNTAAHVFVAIAAEPFRDVTSIVFAHSPENQGTVYIEPASPFRSFAITFDSTSNNNNLVLLNGRKVSDAGIGNRYFYGAGDFFPPVRSVEGTDSNSEGTLNGLREFSRAGQSTEKGLEGIWFASGNPRSGYMLRENGAINFDFDMNDGGSAVNFWHSARDSQISSAAPVLSINPDGIALGGGSTIHRILRSSATLTFTPVAAQTCEERTLTIQNATPSAAVSASPAAPLGSPSLSWQAWVSGSGGVVSVRLCNVSAAGGVAPAAVVWNVSAVE